MMCVRCCRASSAVSAWRESRASSPATSSKRLRRKRSRGPSSMSAARVAVGTVELHLPDVGSLKGKRHVLKGLKDKLRRRFEISVAEVDHHDAWQRATLAVACVSGDSRHANEVISKALDYIEDNVDGYVTDIQVEILKSMQGKRLERVNQ